MQPRDPEREQMKVYSFKSDPDLIEQVDSRLVRFPEFEGSRARLIRKLLREFLAETEPEAIAS